METDQTEFLTVARICNEKLRCHSHTFCVNMSSLSIEVLIDRGTVIYKCTYLALERFPATCILRPSFLAQLAQ